jgi:hypothetical protein
MAQDFPDIPASTELRDSRALILQRDDSLKSNFSGTAFPSTGIVVGQLSYRTDQGKIYVLTNTSPTTWTEVTLAGSTAFLASSGGTLTGNVTLETGAVNQIIMQVSDGSVELTRDTGGAYIDFKNARGDNYDVRLVEVSGGLNVTTTGGGVLAINGNTVWHTANDGAASGLDADLLDGQHGSYYTDIVSRLGYTPANKAGDTFTGAVTFSHVIKEKHANDVASGASIDLSTVAGNFVHITGTTGISTITLSQGQRMVAVFDDVLTLTNGANLILPSGANITTAAGDTMVVVGDGTGPVKARVISYQRASGLAIANMNTARLIGRTTASSGPAEEITVGTGLSLSGGTLSLASTGGKTVIASGSMSGASVVLSSIPATYGELILFIENVSGSNNAVITVGVSDDNNSTLESFSGFKQTEESTPTIAIETAQTSVVGSDSIASGSTTDIIVHIRGYQGGTWARIETYKQIASDPPQHRTGYIRSTTTALNAIRVAVASGTFDGGTYTLLGVV